MTNFRNLVVVAGFLFVVAGPSVARDCDPDTKAKLANVDAAASDRQLLCAAAALLQSASEAKFTIADYAPVRDCDRLDTRAE